MNTLQKNNWSYNQNFSFKSLIDEKHCDEKAQSSLFNGTIVDSNKWDNVDLSNADIEASRILNSNIQNSNLENTDIHSLWVVKTTFDSVSFCGSNIVDCNFINCTFINCDFGKVTLNDCSFENCHLETVNLLYGSFTLNTFVACTFKDMCFKNVFYYTHFSKCLFKDVTMEAYLLGYSYGLTLENLSSFQYLYMGEYSEKNYEEICNDIRQVYQDRGLLINEGILILIDSSIPASLAIVRCFDCLERYILKDCLTKKEQLQFLKKIIESMYKEKMLAPIVMIKILNTIERILSLEENVALRKIASELTQLKNTILTYYYSFIDALVKKIEAHIEYLDRNQSFIINTVYNEKPQYCLSNILNEILDNRQAFVVDAKYGSFTEWISCTDNIISCLEIFLTFMGITVPIIWDIHKEKKEKKNPTENSIEINNTFVNHPTALNEYSIISEITKQAITPFIQNNINQTIKIIINNKFIESANNLGYSDENIKSIKVSNKN